MKDYIKSFKIAFTAEHIKKKGTGIYLLSMLIGLLAPIILFIARFNGSTRHVPKNVHNAFENFFKVSLELFCFYFLPLLIILITTRIAQLDHKNRGWELMETLPVKKFAIFFSKFSIVIIATSIAVFTYALVSILFVYLLSASASVSNLATVELPIAFISNIVLRLLISALFLSALQYVFAVIFSNFFIPIFIGIIGFSLNTYLNESGILLSWYPYASLSSTFRFPNGSDLGYCLTYTDTLSILGCLIVLYIGYYWFKNKSLLAVFIGTQKQMSQTVIVLMPLIALFMYIQTPKQLAAHNTSIIQGEINAPIRYNKLSIVEPFTNDTLVNIPIIDNKFAYKIAIDIPLNRYHIFLDDAHRSHIIFGTKDSIYLNFNIDKEIKERRVTGTRLAENNIRIRNDESIIPYLMEGEDMLRNPSLFFYNMKKEWLARVHAINKFKTVDNYTIRTDSQKRNNTVLLAEYHYFLEEFKNKVALLYPDRNLEIPTDIAQFEKPIPYDETLLNNDFYLYAVLEQLIKDDTQNIDKDTKVLKAIAALDSSKFKDMLMYWQLNKSIQEVSIHKDIDNLLNTYLDQIQDPSFKQRILGIATVKRSLEKGRSAPLFEVETKDGKIVTLSNLKGAYVVIDVWATWCAPCRKETPYFEKFALKYSSDTVRFLAVSVDSDKQRDNWRLSIKESSKALLQLRSLDAKSFQSAYNIKAIPRYMVIAPDGTILNVALPKPSKSNFEPILKALINLE